MQEDLKTEEKKVLPLIKEKEELPVPEEKKLEEVILEEKPE